MDALATRVTAAINAARPGHIIDEWEEPVREADAEFRKRAYEKAMVLLQDKQLQEDFSPSEDSPGCVLEE